MRYSRYEFFMGRGEDIQYLAWSFNSVICGEGPQSKSKPHARHNAA